MNFLLFGSFISFHIIHILKALAIMWVVYFVCAISQFFHVLSFLRLLLAVIKQPAISAKVDAALSESEQSLIDERVRLKSQVDQNYIIKCGS